MEVIVGLTDPVLETVLVDDPVAEAVVLGVVDVVTVPVCVGEAVEVALLVLVILLVTEAVVEPLELLVVDPLADGLCVNVDDDEVDNVTEEDADGDVVLLTVPVTVPEEDPEGVLDEEAELDTVADDEEEDETVTVTVALADAEAVVVTVDVEESEAVLLTEDVTVYVELAVTDPVLDAVLEEVSVIVAVAD